MHKSDADDLLETQVGESDPDQKARITKNKRRLRTGKIFICYRRLDDPAFAHRLYDALIEQYGQSSVTQDVHSIPSGIDFPEFVRDAIGRCRVFVIIIGRNWEERRGSELRIFSTDDHVRKEIELAFSSNSKPLILPIYVKGVPTIVNSDLPRELAKIPTINSLQIDPGLDFYPNFRRVVKAIDGALYAKPIQGLWARLIAVMSRHFLRNYVLLTTCLCILIVTSTYLSNNIPNVIRATESLEKNDISTFSGSADGHYEIARAIQDREALEKDTKLADLLTATNSTFDFFADRGNILIRLHDTLDTMMRSGVHIRIVLVDNLDVNNPNIQLRNRFMPNPDLSISRYVEGAVAVKNEIETLKSNYNRNPNIFKGNFEVRYYKGVFVNSIWLRDAASTKNALGHIQVTYYGDDRLYPIFRFGVLSPKNDQVNTESI